jgi:outer membrane protein
MAGIAVNAELPGGIDISTGYAHDILSKIGGGEASLKFNKSFQIGGFRFSPQIGLNWLSSELANYDFGVPSSKAAPDRPAYSLDSAISLESGIGIFIEITQDWLLILNTSLEYLDRDVTESPIVSEDQIIKGLAFINYVF